MALDAIKKYQILVAPDSNKTQGLQTGDIVRRQYYDGHNLIYSLMAVLDYGTEEQTTTQVVYQKDAAGNYLCDENGNRLVETEQVTNDDGSLKYDSEGHPVYRVKTEEVTVNVPYFIGGLLQGDAPQTNELLDFARITNLFNVDRSGALYLTASDDEAPFMDVIDGIGRDKSLSWPENIPTEAFEDATSQYIVKHTGNLNTTYKTRNTDGCNRVLEVTRANTAGTDFEGLQQDFYEAINVEQRVVISYRAKASRGFKATASLGYTTGSQTDASWEEEFSTDWQYFFQVVTIEFSGRHLRSFKLDLSSLPIGCVLWISDFNIIPLADLSNFGTASAMRLGKLDGIVDPVYGNLTGYGAYIQKLYCSQSAHISGTLTAGDENGFASTFYAGKIHRNVFKNSLDVDFQDGVVTDNDSVINPTGMGNVYKLTAGNSMKAQNRTWLNEHLAERYCFSFWAYAKNPCQIGVQQNGMAVGTIQIASDQTHEWRRCHVYFDLVEPDDANANLIISVIPAFSKSLYDAVGTSIDAREDVMFFTAPQLEKGENCTQYQPTDDILNETDDYGAWFARGGIGGTIQNPLLRLNFYGRGEISTRTNSIQLEQDGSGHLANENIKWDKDGNVTFGKNVTLDWENLGKSTQDEIANRYMRIIGTDTFMVVGQEDVETGKTYSPAQITLSLEEVGFESTSSQRQWYYLYGGEYVAIENGNGATLKVEPESEWFNDESTATFKCVIVLNDARTYTDTFTIKKVYVQGYSVIVTSSKGTAFQNGQVKTVLTAQVYYQGQLVDTDWALENFDFIWHRYNVNNLSQDLGFEDQDETDGANVITLNYETDGSEIFVCELATRDGFDYFFPIIF